MSDFDKAICPMLIPGKCNLPEKEKENLLPDLKYRIFFMLDYKRKKDDILIDTIKEYFKHPYFLMEARDIAGHREKICKICKIALACTCGIASLTPLNHNVFLEIGMLIALGKPILYLFDTTYGQKPEDLPFDISTRMIIQYKDKDELIQGLEREIDLFKDMIKPEESLYEFKRKEVLRNRIKKLDDMQRDFICTLLLEKRTLIPDSFCKKYNIDPKKFNVLIDDEFLLSNGRHMYKSDQGPSFGTHQFAINFKILDDLIEFYNEGLFS